MASERGSGNNPENIPALDAPRQPRNFPDLLRYATEVGGDSSSADPAPLDPERKKFLEEALKCLTFDVAEKLSEAINTLKTLQNPESEHLDVAEYENALERISEFVDSIDAADDYYKLGGFEIANVCLASPIPTIRWKMADILAECTQNNPFCQAQAVAMNFMPTLLKMVDNDVDSNCRVKAFFAVSATVRDCPPALKQFIENDGFSVALRGLQSPSEKLRIKIIFLLSSLIHNSPEVKETIFKMGFVQQLVALIGEEHNLSHEHIISALLSLVQDYPEALAECRKPELDLKLTLQNIVNEHGQDEAFMEEIDYIKELMSLLFTDDAEEER